MKIKQQVLAILLFGMLIIGFPFPNQMPVSAGLEEEYTTNSGNWKFKYTDDFSNQPRNAVTTEWVKDFGKILDDVKQKELAYGFNDPGGYPIGIDIFEQGYNAHGGCRAMNYDPFWLGSNATDPVSSTEPYLVTLHEFFHVIQFCYPLNGHGGKWVTEGQARMLQDKLYSSTDTEGGTDIASYFGQVNGYLENPSRPLQKLSYDAALFWNYITEHYGNDQVEPARGVDALFEFWEAAESIGGVKNPPAVFNLMFDNLGHPSMTLEKVYKDFIVSNFAKKFDVDSTPGKYLYKDENQAPGKYRDVVPTVSETLNWPDKIFGTDYIQSWTPKYYHVKPAFEAGVITFDFNQITDNELFYDLMVIKDGEIIDEIRVTGEDFRKSLYVDADEIMLTVGALENKETDPAKYHWIIKNGDVDPMIVDILEPTSSDVAYVGTPPNPQKFFAAVRVMYDTTPIEGLDKDDFKITIEGKDAYATDSYYAQGIYLLNIQPPSDTGITTNDLQIEVSETSEIESNSVRYIEKITENIIVLDSSLSMETLGKIDAARAAARLYVNSFLNNSNMGLVEFATDANLLKGLDTVSSSRSDIIKAINNIIADGGSTSIGDGLFVAQNEFDNNGFPLYEKNIIILTDGKENAKRYISDVRNLVIDNGTTVHSIVIGNDAEPAELQDLVEKTDGTMHFAFDPSSGTLANRLADIYTTISNEVQDKSKIYSTSNVLTADSWTLNEGIDLPSTDQVTIKLNYRYNGSSLPNLILVDPNNNQISPRFEESQSTTSGIYGHLVWVLNNTKTGTYNVQSSSSSSSRFEYYLDSSMFIPHSMRVDRQLGLEGSFTGDYVPITATISDTAPIVDANVTATIIKGTAYDSRTTRTWDLQLYDDGNHGDGLPNDGTYGNLFTRTYWDGTYIVDAVAHGFDNQGERFQLESDLAFYIHQSNDFDDDELWDNWESYFGQDFVRDGDPDNDRLSNYLEIISGTDPLDEDTDGGGESDYSEYMNGRDPYNPSDDAIEPPYLTAIPADKSVYLNFSTKPHYDFIDVFRSDKSNGTFKLIASSVNASIGTYTDSSVTNGIEYFYRVRAIDNSSNISGLSQVASAMPNFDTTSPSAWVFINNGRNTTTTTSLDISITTSSDVNAMRVSDHASFENATWTTFNSQISYTIPNELGLHVIYIQVRDKAGNVGGFDVGDYTFAGIILTKSGPSGTTSPTTTTSTTSSTASDTGILSTKGLTGVLLGSVGILVVLRKNRKPIL